MIDPFLGRAIAASVALALVAAPLGAVVVWNRMAYFGETIAQASLIGVALALAVDGDVTVGVMAATLAAAGAIIVLSRQNVLPLDSILGLMHHGLLALGVIATAMLKGPSVDLMGYLFGDVLAISGSDLVWIYCGGGLILAALYLLWEPLLRLAVHDELAAAEGVNPAMVRALFVLLLAVAIAFAIKIAGMLLAIAFLIVPVVAARPLASTPERMVALAASIGVASALAGLWLSSHADAPAGPSIVLVMAALAAVSLAAASLSSRS